MNTTQLPSELARLDENVMNFTKGRISQALDFDKALTLSFTPGDMTKYTIVMSGRYVEVVDDEGGELGTWKRNDDIADRFVLFGCEGDMAWFQIGHAGPWLYFLSQWKYERTAHIAAWLFGDLT